MQYCPLGVITGELAKLGYKKDTPVGIEFLDRYFFDGEMEGREVTAYTRGWIRAIGAQRSNAAQPLILDGYRGDINAILERLRVCKEIIDHSVSEFNNMVFSGQNEPESGDIRTLQCVAEQIDRLILLCNQSVSENKFAECQKSY